ncbi:biopolymer transporter ExbD [Sedimentitalea sp. JM2-8]|uniref:Biopolymer transporter ExbD n=1 Tax=Sedimentitalea xiamensis TaxID=3050037 RepID=A0ABT7FIS6_9RHOB|nr:biopolymer transporter ExbD [Sedimentitalea xiamensis]MDK3074699.1 biopolymer transporter ExbD [Sedimentitalea xiamensis]
MFSFSEPRRSRKPSLTPMIDVVFLLLVFFMLASRFGHDAALSLAAAGGGAPYEGPPRLVVVTETGLQLNGQPLTAEDLPGRLAPLMRDRDDLVVLRADADTSLQRLIGVAQSLRRSGITNLAVVE